MSSPSSNTHTSAKTGTAVVLDDVTMSYGQRPVFSGLSASFKEGAISVILGGSGCGKSTVLRLIGGLSRPRSGKIEVSGRDIVGLPERELSSVRQGLGMLFQSGALLDSLSVYENLALPLREQGERDEDVIAATVAEKLKAVGLQEVEGLLPGELSGGMVKRVALARSIIQNPAILLIDEPFSGLDPVSTKLVEALLVRINRELGITMIIVSHHVPSTLRMADNIILLLPAGARAAGTPAELLASEDDRVLNFLNEEIDDTSSDILANLDAFDAESQPRPHRGHTANNRRKRSS
jgi:phospholipid/cholesterol/gamma-HCH transport system ATP-binding protein